MYAKTQKLLVEGTPTMTKLPSGDDLIWHISPLKMLLSPIYYCMTFYFP